MISTVIILLIGILSLGYDLAKHGEAKIGEHNFGFSVIAWVINIALYYWAGLFDKFM